MTIYTSNGAYSVVESPMAVKCLSKLLTTHQLEFTVSLNLLFVKYVSKLLTMIHQLELTVWLNPLLL